MRMLLALVAVAALAGCGGRGAGAPSVTATTSVPPPTGAQTEPTTGGTTTGSGPQVALQLFFLRDGKVAATVHETPATRAVGAAALRLLADGPTPLERAAGVTSEVQHGTEFQLTIDDGTATVVGPPGLSDAAAAQVVYTLTQFPTVRTVRLNGGNAGARADWERMTPPILVLTPVPGETVRSPLHVAGTANTYEATLELELQDAKGKVLAHKVVTATSGSGERGTFETELPFEDAAGKGTLVAFETSAEDGSRTHVVEIPLQLG